MYGGLPTNYNPQSKCVPSATKSVVIRYVECCQCGWTGKEEQQKKIDSFSLKKFGFKGWDHVCPKCNHDEFYNV